MPNRPVQAAWCRPRRLEVFLIRPQLNISATLRASHEHYLYIVIGNGERWPADILIDLMCSLVIRSPLLSPIDVVKLSAVLITC
jgi:hypothetical protein